MAETLEGETCMGEFHLCRGHYTCEKATYTSSVIQFMDSRFLLFGIYISIFVSHIKNEPQAPCKM